MRKFITITIGVLALTIPAAHAADYVQEYVPAAETVGEGRLSVFMWDVYDARLYAPDGEWNEGKPFALELSYLRDIEGQKIAERSIEEMRDLGHTDEVKLASWYEAMERIFPDVDEGMQITGIYTKSGDSIFMLNGQEIGRIRDAEFSKAFFDIWLSEKTSSPDLRKKLLGPV